MILYVHGQKPHRKWLKTMAKTRGNYKTIEQQLWNKTTINETTGCWIKEVNSKENGKGYVKVRVTRNGTRKLMSAHRLSYEIHHGKIPKGKCVMHKCNVRNCWNPDHLTIGTDRDNAEQRDQEGRHRNRFSITTLGPVTKIL